MSRAGWPDGADTVLLARGDNFPDSLAGVSLAHELNAPILLTPTGWLYAATGEEIERLGAGRVIILGGESAVSGAVKEALENEGLAVKRISGQDRYETAAEIARYLAEVRGGSAGTAFVAFGRNFPDALAAASYAAINGYPILLSAQYQLPDDTAAVLAELEFTGAVIAGGPAVIDNAVRDQLAAAGLTVDRISGANRFATSVELAGRYLPEQIKHVYIATGMDFPDALAGAVLAAQSRSGVLLVQGALNEPNPEVQTFILNRGIVAVTIFGGDAAVSDGIENCFGDNLPK